MTRRESGVTIVEVAVVLVIIGLLIGGILRARQMVNSARVRNLAEVSSGIRTAYFGFIDRYNRVPGDWRATNASVALGVAVVGGGNNNGRLDNPPGATVYDESNAMWEQLSKSGFLSGAFKGTAGVEPDVSNHLAPLNAFNNIVTLGRTSDYRGVNPVSLILTVGRGIPVAIAHEFDLKTDDGIPDTGDVRATFQDGDTRVFSGINDWGGREATCVTSSGPALWDVAADSQDCNAAVKF